MSHPVCSPSTRLALCAVILLVSRDGSFGQTTPPPGAAAPKTQGPTGLQELQTLRSQPTGVWSDKLHWGRSTSGVFSEAAARKEAETNYLQEMARREKVNQQMEFVTIRRVAFREATMGSAVEYLRQHAQTSAGSSVNINTVILSPLDAFPPVSLELNNIPLMEAVRYLCEQAGADYAVEPYAIVITKQTKTTTFRNKPQFPAQQPLLSMLVVPQVDFKEASLADSLTALKAQAALLTNGAVTVNFVTKISTDPPPPPITLRLRDIPFMELLRYICDASHASFTVEQHGIVITSVDSPPHAP
jgi:hypothetical protein